MESQEKLRRTRLEGSKHNSKLMRANIEELGKAEGRDSDVQTKVRKGHTFLTWVSPIRKKKRAMAASASCVVAKSVCPLYVTCTEFRASDTEIAALFLEERASYSLPLASKSSRCIEGIRRAFRR